MSSVFSPVSGGSSPRSPASGAMSPSAKSKERKQKKEVRVAALKAEAERIAAGVKTVRILENFMTSQGAAKGSRWNFPTEGGVFPAGRTEVTKFVALLSQRIKELPIKAKEAYAPKREGVTTSNFTNLHKYSDELIGFFANPAVSKLGNMITGRMIPSTKVSKAGVLETGKFVPDISSLADSGRPLSESLIFLVRNQPLYGIVSQGSLSSCMTLHLIRGGTKIPKENQKYSATQEMRQYLANIMEAAVRKDIKAISAVGPVSAARVNAVADAAVRAVRDPSVKFDGFFPEEDMFIFNANNFLRTHTSRLFQVAAEVNAAGKAVVYPRTPGSVLDNAVRGSAAAFASFAAPGAEVTLETVLYEEKARLARVTAFRNAGLKIQTKMAKIQARDSQRAQENALRQQFAPAAPAAPQSSVPLPPQ